MTRNGTLELAASDVCEAIRRHAKICEEGPDNVGDVVLAGEALREAVIRYEKVLSATSGWSNPIRHLGRLPLFEDGPRPVEPVSDAAPAGEERREAARRVRLSAHYHLRVTSEDALLAFASGRFGREVSDPVEAIKILFEAESWDPERYPPGLIGVEEVGVEIS